MSICTTLALTELEQRALGEAMGCWGDDGGIAVMKERLGAGCAVNDDGGAAGARRLRLRVLRTAKEERKSETEGAGGSGRVLA